MPTPARPEVCAMPRWRSWARLTISAPGGGQTWGVWAVAERSSARSSRAPVAVAKHAAVVVVVVVFVAPGVAAAAVVVVAMNAPLRPPRPRARSGDALWTAPTFSLVSQRGSACAGRGGAETESACRPAIAGRRRLQCRGTQRGLGPDQQVPRNRNVHPEAVRQSEGEGSRCGRAGAHAKDPAWRKERPERASARCRRNQAVSFFFFSSFFFSIKKARVVWRVRVMSGWIEGAKSREWTILMRGGWGRIALHAIGADGVPEKGRGQPAPQEKTVKSARKAIKRKTKSKADGKEASSFFLVLSRQNSALRPRTCRGKEIA